jgi:hypothetical protein
MTQLSDNFVKHTEQHQRNHRRVFSPEVKPTSDQDATQQSQQNVAPKQDRQSTECGGNILNKRPRVQRKKSSYQSFYQFSTRQRANSCSHYCQQQHKRYSCLRRVIFKTVGNRKGRSVGKKRVLHTVFNVADWRRHETAAARRQRRGKSIVRCRCRRRRRWRRFDCNDSRADKRLVEKRRQFTKVPVWEGRAKFSFVERQKTRVRE